MDPKADFLGFQSIGQGELFIFHHKALFYGAAGGDFGAVGRLLLRVGKSVAGRGVELLERVVMVSLDWLMLGLLTIDDLRC